MMIPLRIQEREITGGNTKYHFNISLRENNFLDKKKQLSEQIYFSDDINVKEEIVNEADVLVEKKTSEGDGKMFPSFFASHKDGEKIPTDVSIATSRNDLLVNNLIEEFPHCNCNVPRPYDENLDGPFYTHLGTAPTIAEVRRVMIDRLMIRNDQLRIEKVIYTGKEGKSIQGCPVAKWILRRSGPEEKALVVVRPIRFHYCKHSVMIIGICLWDGLPQDHATELYDYLRSTLPKCGEVTERRCGTNEKKTCACQGWNEETGGASFSFGCSWSMYYNGCKFARSASPRKFHLKNCNIEEELILEHHLQTLATTVAPIYKRVAPLSFENQITFENEASDCRLGYKPGRPWSGVTAVVDFCTHSHKDFNNMNNGCTTVLTLTKHRGSHKPMDEQLHVLPLCILDSTDEHGSRDGVLERIRLSSIECLTSYPTVMRVRSTPYICKNKLRSLKTNLRKKNLLNKGLTLRSNKYKSYNKQVDGTNGYHQICRRLTVKDNKSVVNGFPLSNNQNHLKHGLNGINDNNQPKFVSEAKQNNVLPAFSQLAPHFNNGCYSSTFKDLPSFNIFYRPFNEAPNSSCGNLITIPSSVNAQQETINNIRPPEYVDHFLQNSLVKHVDVQNRDMKSSNPSPFSPSIAVKANNDFASNCKLETKFKVEKSSECIQSMCQSIPSASNHSSKVLKAPTFSGVHNFDKQHDPVTSLPIKFNGGLLNVNNMFGHPLEKEISEQKYPVNYSDGALRQPPDFMRSDDNYNPSFPDPSVEVRTDTYKKIKLDQSDLAYSNSGMNSQCHENLSAQSYNYLNSPSKCNLDNRKIWPSSHNNLSNALQNNHSLNKVSSGADINGIAYADIPCKSFSVPSAVASTGIKHCNDQLNVDIPNQPREIFTTNRDVFQDSSIGGVAIALTHGSLLFEVAKRELHATTALKHPNRSEPTRMSLVFYQHKSLNKPFHGREDYEKKCQERKDKKLQEEKLKHQEKLDELEGQQHLLSEHDSLGQNPNMKAFDQFIPKHQLQQSQQFAEFQLQENQHLLSHHLPQQQTTVEPQKLNSQQHPMQCSEHFPCYPQQHSYQQSLYHLQQFSSHAQQQFQHYFLHQPQKNNYELQQAKLSRNMSPSTKQYFEGDKEKPQQEQQHLQQSQQQRHLQQPQQQHQQHLQQPQQEKQQSQQQQHRLQLSQQEKWQLQQQLQHQQQQLPQQPPLQQQQQRHQWQLQQWPQQPLQQQSEQPLHLQQQLQQPQQLQQLHQQTLPQQQLHQYEQQQCIPQSLQMPTTWSQQSHSQNFHKLTIPACTQHFHHEMNPVSLHLSKSAMHQQNLHEQPTSSSNNVIPQMHANVQMQLPKHMPHYSSLQPTSSNTALHEIPENAISQATISQATTSHYNTSQIKSQSTTSMLQHTSYYASLQCTTSLNTASQSTKIQYSTLPQTSHYSTSQQTSLPPFAKTPYLSQASVEQETFDNTSLRHSTMQQHPPHLSSSSEHWSTTQHQQIQQMHFPQQSKQFLAKHSISQLLRQPPMQSQFNGLTFHQNSLIGSDSTTLQTAHISMAKSSEYCNPDQIKTIPNYPLLSSPQIPSVGRPSQFSVHSAVNETFDPIKPCPNIFPYLNKST